MNCKKTTKIMIGYHRTPTCEVLCDPLFTWLPFSSRSLETAASTASRDIRLHSVAFTPAMSVMELLLSETWNANVRSAMEKNDSSEYWSTHASSRAFISRLYGQISSTPVVAERTGGAL